MAKVSVIIPTYNVEQYIERCARSLFEQTLEDIEYIFIDDCSLDKSIEILMQIINEYPNRKDNVIIHRMKENGGQAIARKWGVQNAKGDFIIHCDSDDWVDKHMYENMYNKAIMDNSDVVICDFSITNGKEINKPIKACHANTPIHFLENCLFQKDPWSLCNKLFSKKIYNNIEFTESSMGEDLATTTQLFMKVRKMSYIPEIYYYYFQNPQSTIHLPSEEAVLRRYYQLKDNTNIAIRHLEESEPLKNIVKRAKPLLQMSSCVPLLALFNKKEIRKKWRKACPYISLWYLIKTPFSLYSKYSYIKYSIKYCFTK